MGARMALRQLGGSRSKKTTVAVAGSFGLAGLVETGALGRARPVTLRHFRLGHNRSAAPGLGRSRAVRVVPDTAVPPGSDRVAVGRKRQLAQARGQGRPKEHIAVRGR
jgi:hypothetical protein